MTSKLLGCLSSAQLAIAREYGFPSWAKLKLEVERRDILNGRDLSRLTRLPSEHPDLAVSPLERWADRACGEPLGYITMMRFNHGRLGLPAQLPGTGAIAKALIEAGALVNGHPGDKETPLITAASSGDAEVARALIDAGAEIHNLEMAAAAGDITRWPLDRFTLQSRLRALVFAADHQRLEAIDRLVAAGTPVNEPDAEWGRLPLHAAAGNGRAAGVRRLLAHGADPNLRDPEHNTTPLEETERENSLAHREVEAILRPLTRGGAPHVPSGS